jgi:predicted dehydrogenase
LHGDDADFQIIVGGFMRKLNYALIGFGGIAVNRIAKEGFAVDRKRFEPLRSARLVGATDVMPVRKQAVEMMGLTWFDSVEELCSDAAIDGVFIATNNRSHYPLARKAMEAGKHVIVEKPLTTTLEDAQDLVQLAERQNLSLAVDHMMQHNAYNIKAARIIQRGILGEVQNIVLHMEFPYGYTVEEASTWRCSDPEEVGGPIGDVASHCLYMAEFLLNERILCVQGVYTPAILAIKVENGAFIKFKTEKNTPGAIRVSFCEQRGTLASTLLNLGYEVYGSRKTLRAHGTLFQLSGHPDEPIKQRLEIDDGRSVKQVPVGRVQNIYRTVIDNHARSIERGKRSSGEDALHNLALVLNIHRSAKANGTTISL